MRIAPPIDLIVLLPLDEVTDRLHAVHATRHDCRGTTWLPQLMLLSDEQLSIDLIESLMIRGIVSSCDVFRPSS